MTAFAASDTPGGNASPPRVPAASRVVPVRFSLMQHVTIESKDLLLGDEAADVLTEYAALLADHGGGDRVRLNAISGDGDEVVVTVVLSRGSTLLTETAHTGMPEPDNREAIAVLRRRIQRLRTPPPVQPVDSDVWESQFDEL